MSGVIPVVVFAYRRADLLARTLAGLRANDVPLVIAYCDGPRDADAEPGVAEVRRLLRAVTWTKTEIIERTENLGLGKSIVTGTTEVFAAHDTALIFEDDIVAGPGMYAWMTAALRRYAGDPRVMSVGAWTHPRLTPRSKELAGEPFFSHRVNIWGWGSWRRAWDGMDSASASQRLTEFAARGGDPARYGDDIPAYAAIERERNLWAVRFIALHLLRGGLSITPPRTLALHVGYDARATNPTRLDAGWDQDLPATPLALPVVWPEPVEDPEIAGLWRKVLAEDAAALATPLWRRVARAARRILKGGTR